MRRTSTGIAYMEHRCGTRVALSARATVTTTSRDCAVACVTDASVTGAFIETSIRPPLLSQVAVRLPASLRAATLLEAYVVRHEDRGIAVEWLEPGSDETMALLSLARQQHEQAFSHVVVAEPAASVSSF